MSLFGLKQVLSLLLIIFTTSNALETPVVGILSQEPYLVQSAYPDAHSFIAASYVKLLEASGARVIPIWIGQNDAYYERVVSYTNGIVFPGGGTYFNETKGYGEAAATLYKLALKANDKGVHYPLWGICLGLQVLMFAAVGDDIRKDCTCKDVSLPLDFAPDYEKSRLFSGAPPSILENLKTKNLTYNYHRYCIFEDDLRKNDLLEHWTIISRNRDTNDVEFVSAMEHKDYPFYGIQFHPEKNPFEFKAKTKVSHCAEGVEAAQYFSNFFVQETRKNNQTFPTAELESSALIYNYNATYSGLKTSYEQLYLFSEEDCAQNLLA